MSFENKQKTATGEILRVETRVSARVIRVCIVEDNGENANTTLNVEECDALIHVLQAASHLASVYKVV